MSDDEKQMIEVTINGDKRNVPAGLTVNGLLDHLNVKKAAAVVEHNRTVLKKHETESIMVVAGDTLEIVRFVGGG
jgi:sulfur carrier protein